MTIYLWCISIFWMAIGVTFVIIPSSLKKILKLFSKLPKIALGGIPLILGLLLILSSSASSFSFYIAMLGMLGIVKGLSILLIPMDTLKTTVKWWLNQYPALYRFWGIVLIILALLVILGILPQ